MKVKWYRVLSLATMSAMAGLLVSCGQGPILTCKSECTPPKQRDIFCDCVDWSSAGKQNGRAAPVVWVTKGQYGQCPGQCVNSRPTFLKNTSANQVTVKVQKITRFRNSGSQREEFTEVVPGLGSVGLGCDVASEAGGQLCSVSYDWSILQSSAANMTPRPTRAIKYAQLMAEGPATLTDAQTQGLQCIDECNAKSPACASIPPSNETSKLADQLSQVRSLVMSKDTKPLALNKLMRIFDQKDDPCGRGDLVLSGNKVTNDGELCVLSTKLAFPDGSTPVLALMVPEHLEGQMSRVDDKFTAFFGDEEKAIILQIDDPDLQAERGGQVVEVTSTLKDLYVGTASSCLHLQLP
jgi:hypothetical protein